MNIQDNGAAPERVDFSKIKTSIPIPNLIEVQKTSYERFLQMDLLPNEREDIGLQTVFNSVFPISDFPWRQRPGVRRLFHRQLGMQVRQPQRAASSALDLPELRRHHPHRPLPRRRRALPSLRDLQ
jgi:DNA-directed RNA polymerase beta subunit